MATVTNDNLKVNAPKLLDSRSSKNIAGRDVPYDSIEEALASINPFVRVRNLPVFILKDGVSIEYSFRDNLTDLIEKNVTPDYLDTFDI